MNRPALIGLYRSLTRHRLYSALNIGGLALGIAVFLVLALYVRFETGYERWLPDHGRIYLVQTDWLAPDSPFTGIHPDTMGGLLEEMKQDHPGLVGTRIDGGKDAGSVIHGGIATLEDIGQVDPDFLRIFHLRLLAGNAVTALADPTAVLVSRSTARRYFGDTDPVGQTMTIDLDTPLTYHVTGVFEDLPKDTELRFSILTRIPAVHTERWWHHWGSTSVTTFLRFPTPADAAAYARTLPAFIDRRGQRDMGAHASRQIGLTLLPFEREHLQPVGQASASRKAAVVTLGLVGVLALLIAMVNYVNLATARAGLRAREIAMRKVLGASRAALIRQFLGEAVLTAALAALFGLVVAELSLPFVNAAGGLSLAIPYGVVVPGLVVLAVVVGVVAGLYPAFLLSRFPAALALASARAPGGGRSGTRLREALVVFQFGLAIAFMIGTAVLFAQLRHLRETDLGFRRDGLIVVSSLNYGNLDPVRKRAIIDAFARVPGVVTVGTADTSAGGFGNNNMDNVEVPGGSRPGPSLRTVEIGSDFFATYRPRLLAGRLFDRAHKADAAIGFKWQAPHNVVINRTAVAKLGYASPQQAVGRTVWQSGPRTIVGVVDDLRFFSPRVPSDPTIYIAVGGLPQVPVVTLRFTGEARPVLDALEAVWHRMAPRAPFVADTAAGSLAKFYEEDDQAARLFAIGAGLAVLIGCVGLWGLALFNTQRRIKEIGIRKTLGASSADIVRLLVGQFLRPVLLANLIAWPLAYGAMRLWLAGFSDRIALSPIYFVAASLLALLIAVATTLAQALRASRATPAWAMRYE